MPFNTDQTLGIDFTKTDTAALTSSFALGERRLGSDGITYMRVRATAAKSQGLVYIVDNTFTVGNGITTSGVSVAPVACVVPQTTSLAPDAGETYAYFWAGVKGPLSIAGVGSCSANVELFTTSTAGLLNSSISGAKRLEGVKFTSAVTTDSAVTAAFSVNDIGCSTDA